MDAKDSDSLKKLPFEKALERLEEIVAQMEDGKLSLDQMMKFYEEGQALSGICSARLKSIEKKIEILRDKGGGEKAWENFDVSDSAEPAAEPRPRKSAKPIRHTESTDAPVAEELF
ncbi:MAG: exodeoxyribonuclease VII small subunit [Victivallales bacterium]|nr:exodeoxyribonuclease VII small subunit [Victivallales bacterium]